VSIALITFAEFNGSKNAIRDIARNRETNVSGQKIDPVWNTIATTYRDPTAPVLRSMSDGNLYLQCNSTSGTITDLARREVPRRENQSLPKKDF
jgi:hypothetical protein